MTTPHSRTRRAVLFPAVLPLLALLAVFVWAGGAVGQPAITIDVEARSHTENIRWDDAAPNLDPRGRITFDNAPQNVTFRLGLTGTQADDGDDFIFRYWWDSSTGESSTNRVWNRNLGPGNYNVIAYFSRAEWIRVTRGPSDWGDGPPDGTGIRNTMVVGGGREDPNQNVNYFVRARLFYDQPPAGFTARQAARGNVTAPGEAVDNAASNLILDLSYHTGTPGAVLTGNLQQRPATTATERLRVGEVEFDDLAIDRVGDDYSFTVRYVIETPPAQRATDFTRYSDSRAPGSPSPNINILWPSHYFNVVPGRGRVLGSGRNFFGQLGKQRAGGSPGGADIHDLRGFPGPYIGVWPHFNDAPVLPPLLNPIPGWDRQAALGRRAARETTHPWFFRLWTYPNEPWPQGLDHYQFVQADEQVGEEPVDQAVSAAQHSVSLRADGRVKVWGLNDFGQLGTGDKVDRASPVLLPEETIKNVVGVAAGLEHTVAVLEDGTVWTWGSNRDGRLGIGDGSVDESLEPVQVVVRPDGPLEGVVAVSAGERHSLALKRDGSVWAWGYNNEGQLGDGTYVGKNRAVQAKAFTMAKFRGHDDDVLAVDVSSDGTRVATASADDRGMIWDAVSGNRIATLDDGPGFANMHTGPVNKVAFLPGDAEVATASSDGTIKLWRASDGRYRDVVFQDPDPDLDDGLAHAGSIRALAAIEYGPRHYLVTGGVDRLVKVWDASTGDLVGTFRDGDLDSPDPDDPGALRPAHDRAVNAVVCLVENVAGVDVLFVFSASADRTVKKWLAFHDPVSDSPDFDNILVTAPFGTLHDGSITSLAISGDGQRLVTGSSDHSAMLWDADNGAHIRTFESHKNQNLDGHRLGVTSVDIIRTAAGDFVLTGSLDNTAKRWFASGAQEGDVDRTFYRYDRYSRDGAILAVRFAPVDRVVDALEPATRTIQAHDLILTGGTDNLAKFGETPIVKAIDAGGLHSLALRDDGTVWSWGMNIRGQLGLGHTTRREMPVQVTALPAGFTATAISGGQAHSLALGDTATESGTVYAWGYNRYGELGVGDTVQRNTPVQVTEDRPGNPVLENVQAISAGWGYSLARKGQATVFTSTTNSDAPHKRILNHPLELGVAVDEHVGRYVRLTSGDASGGVRRITANTADTLTFGRDTTDDNDSFFKLPAGATNAVLDSGDTAQVTGTTSAINFTTSTIGGTTSHDAYPDADLLVDDNRNWPPGSLVGMTVRITSGSLAGESQTINANTRTTLTTAGVFTQPVPLGSGYVVESDSHLVVFGANWTPDEFENMQVNDVTGGPEVATITGNTAETITLQSALSDVVPPGTSFDILPPDDVTLIDRTQNWIPGEYTGLPVRLTSGPQPPMGQTRQITANSQTTLTIAPAFTDGTDEVTIAPNTSFEIGSPITLIDTTKNWVRNEHVGRHVRLAGGPIPAPMVGQWRTISANSATTLTFDSPMDPDDPTWMIPPGTSYVIESPRYLVDTNQNWTPGEHVGRLVRLTDGTGFSARVVANTAFELELDQPFDPANLDWVVPQGTGYEIFWNVPSGVDFEILEGVLWGWGHNVHGQLGRDRGQANQGDNTDVLRAVWVNRYRAEDAVEPAWLDSARHPDNHEAVGPHFWDIDRGLWVDDGTGQGAKHSISAGYYHTLASVGTGGVGPHRERLTWIVEPAPVPVTEGGTVEQATFPHGPDAAFDGHTPQSGVAAQADWNWNPADNSGWVDADRGTTLWFRAVPRPGYVFTHWSRSFEGTDPVHSWTVGDDEVGRNPEVRAHFLQVINQHQITVNIQPYDEAGGVTGAGNYPEFSEEILQATPSVGYAFVRWETDDDPTIDTSTIPRERVIVDKDKTFTAVFEKMTPTLTVELYDFNYPDPPGSTVPRLDPNVGEVTLDPPPGAGGVYQFNDVVVATAVDDTRPDYRFREWQGDADGTPHSVIIVMDGDKTLEAMFQKRFRVQVSADPEGSDATVNGNPFPYEEYFDFEDDVDLTAQVSPGALFEFREWSGDVPVGADPANPTITLAGLAEDKYLVANFNRLYLLNVTVEPDATPAVGSVAVDPDEPNYASEDVVNLTATPAPGYRFLQWVGDVQVPDPDNNPHVGQVVMDSDKDVAAEFEEITHPLTIASSPVDGVPIGVPGAWEEEGNVVATPHQRLIREGSSPTLTAPQEFTTPGGDTYEFARWVVEVGASPPIEDTERAINVPNITEDIVAVAEYRLERRLDVRSFPPEGVAITGPLGGSTNYWVNVENLDSVTLVADETHTVGVEQYRFRRWRRDGVPQPAYEPQLSFVITKDTVVEAEYELDEVDDDEDDPIIHGHIPPRPGMGEPGVQVPVDTLFRVLISDAGKGVDYRTVAIQFNGEDIYDGSTETSERVFDSREMDQDIRGVCRRSGTRSEFEFVFHQPDRPFLYDHQIDVEIVARDLNTNPRANEATDEYTLHTELRSFARNTYVDWTGTAQGPPDVAMYNGDVWAVWEEIGSGVRIAKLAAGEASFGEAEVVVEQHAAGRLMNPAIAIAPNGAIAVAYERQMAPGFATSRVRVAISHVESPADWDPEIDFRSGLTYDQQKPAIAVCNEDGIFYLAWQDRDSAPDGYDIWVADSPDGVIWNTQNLSGTQPGDQAEPAVAVNADGTAFAVWMHQQDIWGASSTDWATPVHVVERPSALSSPALAAESDGDRMHLLWLEATPQGRDVFHASFDGGLPDDPLDDGDSIADDVGLHTAPALAVRGSGAEADVFACWQDDRYRSQGEDWSIYFVEGNEARRPSSFGTNVEVNDEAFSAHPQTAPAIVVDGDGFPFLVWLDGRGDVPQVYFARAMKASVLASREVDPAQTETVSAANAIVEIPAGSISQKIVVSISKLEQVPVLPERAFGSVFNFSPSGLTFDPPAIITIPVDPDDIPDDEDVAVYYFKPAEFGEEGQWLQDGIESMEGYPGPGVPGRGTVIDHAGGKAVRFRTTHFTLFALGGATPLPPDPDPDPDPGDPGVPAPPPPAVADTGTGCSLSVSPGPGDFLLLLAPCAALAALALRRVKKRRA